MSIRARLVEGVRRFVGRPQTHSAVATSATAPTYTRRGVLALGGKLILGSAAAAVFNPIACESSGGLQCGDSLEVLSDQIRSLLTTGVGERFVGGRMLYVASATIEGREMGLGDRTIAIRLGLRPAELGFNAEGRLERSDTPFSACEGAIVSCSPYTDMEKVGLVIGGVRAKYEDKPLLREITSEGHVGVWAYRDVMLTKVDIPEATDGLSRRVVLQEKSGLGRYFVEAQVGEGELSRPAYFEVDENGNRLPQLAVEGINPADLVDVLAIYGLYEPTYLGGEAVFVPFALDSEGYPMPNVGPNVGHGYPDISDRVTKYLPVSKNDLYDPSNPRSASIQDIVDGNEARGITALGLNGVEERVIPLKAIIELEDLRRDRSTRARIEIPNLEKLELDPVTGEPNLEGITSGINPETEESVSLATFFDGSGPNFKITISVEAAEGAGTPDNFYTWVTALGGSVRLEGCL